MLGGWLDLYEGLKQKWLALPGCVLEGFEKVVMKVNNCVQVECVWSP